jgi:hypothetical protein
MTEEVKHGNNKEMDAAMDLIQKCLADGTVEYLLVARRSRARRSV